jgi:capsular exopolysaccharide synthesis family protein
VFRFRRWILFAIIPALIIGALDYARTNAQARTYATCTQLYVQTPDNSAAGSGTANVNEALMLIPTYVQMVTSPVVEADASKIVARRYPGYDISSYAPSASTGQSDPTFTTVQLMNVCVNDTIPARAAFAADAASVALINQVKTLQTKRYQKEKTVIDFQLSTATQTLKNDDKAIRTYRGPQSGLQALQAQLSADTGVYQAVLNTQQQFNLSEGTSLNSVSLFAHAAVPTTPTGPHPARAALLAAFIVLLIGSGLIYGYEYIDDSPRSPEEIEEIVGAPILGSVRRFQGNNRIAVTGKERYHHEVDDAYRTIRANLRFANVDNPLHSLVITSALPAEGKSTTASNLARVFAEGGQTAVLVDADLRRPSQHKIFDTSRTSGLTGILVGTEEFNGHLPAAQILPNLSLITSGPLPPRPADLLESARMREFVHDLERKSNIVVIDTPPLLAVADASVLATVVSGVVLVVDPSKAKRRDLKGAREAIENLGGHLVGVVINGLSARDQASYRYSYSGYYAYSDLATIEGRTRKPAENTKV